METDKNTACGISDFSADEKRMWIDFFCPKTLLCNVRRGFSNHVCASVRASVRPHLSGDPFWTIKSQILKGFRRKSGPENGPKG